MSEDETCMLEREPLVKLARDGRLNLHQPDGSWPCLDTQRDREQLTKLVESGSPPVLK
jgi:glucose-1-phosphate cytidylyltransferase